VYCHKLVYLVVHTQMCTDMSWQKLSEVFSQKQYTMPEAICMFHMNTKKKSEELEWNSEENDGG